MRQLVNIAALGCLLACGAVFATRTWADVTLQQRTVQCETSLSKLRQIVKRHAGLADAKLNGRGWPETIQEGWFEGEAPRNPFLTGRRPWIEVAASDEALLTHPFIRCDVSGTAAEFWYNPYLGIVRARVPYLRSDRETLALYNDVNDCDLSALFTAPPVSDAATMAAVESGVVQSDGSR